MIRFSANLGLLWRELNLVQAISAAAQAGFDAVECHWPYDVAATEVAAVLRFTGMPMLSINTPAGDTDVGEFGLLAVPGKTRLALQSVDQAIDYANQINCRCIHAMAGITSDEDIAEQTYRKNLEYACDRAVKCGINILIEPINHKDIPGYHLTTIEAARETLLAVGHPNLKIMCDCYHMQVAQGDILSRISSNLKHIEHIQIASVPDRAEPDSGEVDYAHILPMIYQLGYQGYIGAEYKPHTTTADGLHWLNKLRF